MRKKALVVNRDDNVAVAVTSIKAGESIEIERSHKEVIKVRDDIEYGHKFSLEDLAAGDHVIKYGEVIGKASRPIIKGSHVHVHNLESLRGRGDL